MKTIDELKQEAKGLGMKGIYTMKDTEKLQAKINDFRALNEKQDITQVENPQTMIRGQKTKYKFKKNTSISGTYYNAGEDCPEDVDHEKLKLYGII